MRTSTTWATPGKYLRGSLLVKYAACNGVKFVNRYSTFHLPLLLLFMLRSLKNCLPSLLFSHPARGPFVKQLHSIVNTESFNVVIIVTILVSSSLLSSSLLVTIIIVSKRYAVRGSTCFFSLRSSFANRRSLEDVPSGHLAAVQYPTCHDPRSFHLPTSSIRLLAAASMIS